MIWCHISKPAQFLCHGLTQRFEFMLDGMPHQCFIYIVILMAVNVSRCGDTCPGDLRVALLQLIREATRGF